jgi:hypothetical protein
MVAYPFADKVIPYIVQIVEDEDEGNLESSEIGGVES